MGGGLLQLATPVSNFDQFLTVNPDISFYQYVYKKHTNFAMESRINEFLNIPPMAPFSSGSAMYRCNINLSGDIDLINDMYFSFTLPEIYSSDKYKFRWIQNVGTVFLKSAKVYIDGMQIDQLTGEWMHIWNELSAPEGDTRFDRLVGNAPELQDPKLSLPRVAIKNNKFIYFYYPEGTPGSPSIDSRRIVLPLKFWFTKSPALSLPVFRFAVGGMITHTVSVEIELNSSEKLYQVYSEKMGMYVSPAFYNQLHNENINIYTFTKSSSIPIDITPNIEVNTVTLSNEERGYLYRQPILTYLVEQLTINTPEIMISSSDISRDINVQVNNPTKELVWVIKRSDLDKFNDYSNYSADLPESTRGILKKAYIKFNNNSRIEEKDAEYFSMIQPYQFHTKIPKPGIYCYSFCLHPEKEFLSGSYNAAALRTTLNVALKQNNNDYINHKMVQNGLQPYQYDYIVNVYAINYNIFEMVSSTPGLKFTVST
jgi:hypothetical protein